MMWKLLSKIKDCFVYDADREFYAKVFPNSVNPSQLVRLRKMDTSDLKAVLAIEKQNYEFPWSEAIFKDCFGVPGYRLWICEDANDRIIGYCILSIIVDEAHIMNVSVSPDWQGQGIGRKMLEHMIAYAKTKAEKMLLEVRPLNISAIKLYKSLGFREIGIRKNYYPAKNNGREDALMLELALVAPVS